MLFWVQGHINVNNSFAPPPDIMIMFFDNRLAPPIAASGNVQLNWCCSIWIAVSFTLTSLSLITP